LKNYSESAISMDKLIKNKKQIMKKLFLGLAVIAGSFAFAQQKTSTSPVNFGVKAGLNVATMSKENYITSRKPLIGFNAGFFANVPVSGNFSVQPEILYSQYGGKVDIVKDGIKLSATRKLDYITVPVMLQYNALPNLYFEAGPEFGFKVSSKMDIKNENTGSAIKGNIEDAKGFNLGLGIGAGYYITPNFGITARYIAGLTDVAKDNRNDRSLKNNVFQVGLAYKFK
jgi:outer membrane immunogenic protein